LVPIGILIETIVISVMVSKFFLSWSDLLSLSNKNNYTHTSCLMFYCESERMKFISICKIHQHK